MATRRPEPDKRARYVERQRERGYASVKGWMPAHRREECLRIFAAMRREEQEARRRQEQDQPAAAGLASPLP